MKRGTRKLKKTVGSYWGYHLLVNAADCTPDAIRSASTIREFTKELVDAIDMVSFGSPMVVRFGEGNKEGYSLVQLIETYNITAHFVEQTNDIYLDIFSCKPFNQKDAMRVFKKYFNPRKVEVQFIKRQAPRS